MDQEEVAADGFDVIEGAQEGLLALEEGDIPQGTTEPTAPGQTGDPLEVLYKAHPETLLDYAEKIAPLLPLRQVPPDQQNLEGEAPGDPYHTSQPFLSVFERTKILGFRANQLAQGARPYIVVPEHVSGTLDIARLELEQRRLPFIIKRPMPNGTFEYWRLSDMMVI
jgi:DNA-directed RNA polymerase I, II, and III subunit RPABC2